MTAPDPAEIAASLGEREAEALAAARADCDHWRKDYTDLQAVNAALRAQVATMREALEPFAKAADVRLCGEWRDDERFGGTDASSRLTFCDLRRARSALEFKGQVPAASPSGELEEIACTARGYTIYREPNGAGGHRYWSDSIGGGVVIWDTCLASTEDLGFAMDYEAKVRGEAGP